MIQPDVEIDDGTGRIIISSEEGETEGLFNFFLILFEPNKTCISHVFKSLIRKYQHKDFNF
jgi:hypothetical protein